MNDVPIFKQFIQNNKPYVYDTFSNTLFEISKDDYKNFHYLACCGIQEYRNTYGKEDRIIHLINKGFFQPLNILKVEHPEMPFTNSLLKNNINCLILQVTQDCNFTCRYCGYSKCDGFVKHQAQREMSWDIARMSVDFLYDHSSCAETISIAFYGGEPFLNFKLIKKVIKYVLDKFYTRSISFYITTNGSALNDEIISFISNYNIKVSISLDGPPENQNSHRKLKNTGNDTFDIVDYNIRKIRSHSITYFNDYIRFLPVIFEGESESDVVSYISHRYNVDAKKIKVHNASLQGIDYYYDDINIVNNSNNDLPNNNKISANNLAQYNRKYENKSMISNKWHHSGQCLPGYRSLFVDYIGNFYPCEKCVENDGMSIGNINDGIDYNKVTSFFEIGKLTEQECKKCWALRFCDICIVRCFDLEKNSLSRDLKLLACEQEKERALLYLKSKTY